MKGAANEAGGGGAVALWQPALIAAAGAPCFLIFPDHQNKPSSASLSLSVCVCDLFEEENSLDLRHKQSVASFFLGVIKSINFGIHLTDVIKYMLLALMSRCKSRQHV